MPTSRLFLHQILINFEPISAAGLWRLSFHPLGECAWLADPQSLEDRAPRVPFVSFCNMQFVTICNIYYINISNIYINTFVRSCYSRMPSGPWIVIKQLHYAASEPNEPTILWLILVRWLRPSDALQGLPRLDKAHTLVLGPLRLDKGSKELISGTILAGNSMVLFKCFLQQAFEY